MKLRYYGIISIALFILISCAAENKSSDKKLMTVNESQTGLSFRKLKNQDQLVNSQGSSRGVLDAYLISLATNGIKSMIDKRKKKYTAEYSMALTDLHFYNNLSTNGIFDPNGIIFKGFTLIRLAKNKESHKMDTALIAHFLLDTTNSYEIANICMFRLKLDSIDYKRPKAKYNQRKKTMNMDFEITFNCSYVNETGNFFSNVELGKFYLSLRNAPLDKNSANYTSFYQKLRDTSLTGASFIVPRSYGYYVSEDKLLKPSYSWGNYSISASITESSKEAFVDQMISDNSDLIINASKSQLNNASNKIINSNKAKK